MARKSRIKRQIAVNEQRARQQRDKASHNRRKARNRNVDTSMVTTTHPPSCPVFSYMECTCG